MSDESVFDKVEMESTKRDVEKSVNVDQVLQHPAATPDLTKPGVAGVDALIRYSRWRPGNLYLQFLADSYGGMEMPAHERFELVAKKHPRLFKLCIWLDALLMVLYVGFVIGLIFVFTLDIVSKYVDLRPLIDYIFK